MAYPNVQASLEQTIPQHSSPRETLPTKLGDFSVKFLGDPWRCWLAPQDTPALAQKSSVAIEPHENFQAILGKKPRENTLEDMHKVAYSQGCFWIPGLLFALRGHAGKLPFKIARLLDLVLPSETLTVGQFWSLFWHFATFEPTAFCLWFLLPDIFCFQISAIIFLNSWKLSR